MIKFRIDVDYPYPSRVKSFIHTALNKKAGRDYLKNSKIIARMINESTEEVKAYWFFTFKTIPDEELLPMLNPERHEVALTAVDPSPARMLGLLDRDSPLPLLDEDDSDHGEDEAHDEYDHGGEVDLALLHLPDHVSEIPGKTGDDAGHDDDAHAVADAVVVNELAQPYQEHRPGRKAQYGDEVEASRGVGDELELGV